MKNYFFLVTLFLLVCTSSLLADIKPLAEVIAYQGTAYYKDSQELNASWKKISTGMFLAEGMEIYTEKNSSLELDIENIYIKIGPASHFLLKNMTQQARLLKVQGELFSGEIWSKAVRIFGNLFHYEVITPSAVAGVQGTNFLVSHINGKTEILVAEGSVLVSSRDLYGREIVLGAAEKVLVSAKEEITPVLLGNIDKEVINEMNRWGQDKERNTERKQEGKNKEKEDEHKDRNKDKDEDKDKEKGSGGEGKRDKEGQENRDDKDKDKDKDNREGPGKQPGKGKNN